MKVFIPDQLRAVLIFFLSGIAFGAVRDLIRFIGMTTGCVPVPERRRRCSPKKEGKTPSLFVRFWRWTSVFSADVLFFLFVAAVFTVMTYALCGGRFRSYSVFSAAAGFYLYSVFPGKAIRVPLELGAYLLRRAFRAAVRIVMIPMRRFGSAVKRFVAVPLVSYYRRIREARRLKRSEKLKEKNKPSYDTREPVCSVGRRRSF